MSRLSNKVVLITGGGSGVGLATARQCLAEGGRVAIAGRDAAKLERAVAELAAGDRLAAFRVDVGELSSVEQLVANVRNRFERVDVLVNNAGVNIRERTFRELSAESWHKLLRTNLDGAFYCTKTVFPEMLARRDGVVIHINSVSGKRGYPLAGTAYCASKFGLTGMASCLAAEEKDSGVRFCTIYPGEIDTSILDERPTPVTAEQRQVILKPDDVAAAVLFVATLPPHVSVPELVIKPATHAYV